MHNDEQTAEASRPGSALLTGLTVNLALGIIFLVYLLVLPSDPENALVGRYSQQRVLLLAGILAAIIASAAPVLALSVKRPWRQSLGEMVLGKNGFVKQILPFSPLLLAPLFLVPLLFLPAQLEGLTTYHYSRLAPYLLWPLAFSGALGVGYWLLWTPPRLHLGSKTTEGIAVVFLFLLSFAARAPLSGYGLPYQAVWDEVVTYPRALELLSGMEILEEGTIPGYGRASYGDLVTTVTAAGQVVGLFSKLRTGAVSSVVGFSSPAAGVGSVFEAVHGSGAPLQYPRILFALITSICPVLVYLALRRYFGVSAWAALAGGGMYAVLSPDIIYFSAFILPDAMATTMALGAVMAGMEGIHSPRDRRWADVICGVLVGACVSMSIRYVSLVPIPFVALAFSPNRRKWVERVAVMTVALVAGFLVTSPTLVFDMPVYLARLAQLGWVGDDSFANRVVSLSFYARGAFLGNGFGLVVLGLALVGFALSLQRRRRLTLFLSIIVILHLFLITPTLFRVTRHALVLYPFIAIFAAVALGSAQDRLRALLLHLQVKLLPQRTQAAVSPGAAGAIVLLLFLGVSLPKIQESIRFVEKMRAFEPSQVQMAEYVREHLMWDTKIALLEIVPFADAHLRRSRADVHRVSLRTTLDELRQAGYEYVIGTDSIGHEFGHSEGTIWVSDLLSDKESLAEFGSADLRSRGWPVGNIKIYLARVPALEPDP